MSMISVTLPDGSVNEYAAGITAEEIVIDIEGRKHDCVAASVDGIERDFSTILQSDCAVEGISDSVITEYTFSGTAQLIC